jgi:putative membrane-bound dehydrogenase-like protein
MTMRGKMLEKSLWALAVAALVGSTISQGGAESAPPQPAPAGPRFKKQELDEHFWAEGAGVGDFNRDGIRDVVAGPYWYAGPDFEARHEYYPAAKSFERAGKDGAVEKVPGFEGALGSKNVYSDNFFAYTPDLDGDGWQDILIIGFPGEAAAWYRNPQNAGGHWKRHLVMEGVDNESAMLADVDGDGKPELVCHHGGFLGYAKPRPDDPAAPWTFTRVSPRSDDWTAYTHGLGVGDVNGDGKADLIEAEGWWEQPAGPAKNKTWKRHRARFGHGAQFHAYDVSGDGLPDVVGSIDAHGYGLAWHEQMRNGRFRKHLVLPEGPAKSGELQFSQLHAVDLVDLDGDGLKDIVTGKRFWAHGSDGDPEPNAAAVLYWFKLTRQNGKAEFLPRLIDSDSGIGTQVTVADANGDARPDIVVANKKGTFVHVQEFGGFTPVDAAQAMSLPPGFRATAFASEPDVKQPIAFAIDDRGRVWVAEAYTYPVRRPEGQGTDRILVFEDRDGDGRFDKRTVFMSGLNLVSGLEVGFGGVWVGSAPHLLFIPMQDGDEPAPAGAPRIVLDGWGYEDTHETLNTFTWGPDGWLYGAHGVFTHSAVGKPGTPDTERIKLNAGIWRYHPTKDRFEVFAEGTSNPWGLDFDDRGQLITEACVIPHLWHLVQGGRFERQESTHFDPHVYADIKTVADHLHYRGGTPHDGNGVSDDLGGGHAHAGLMIYLGGSWPEQYRGVAFMNNIHGARINADVLERRGSGFVGRHSPDLIRFNDPWSQIVNLQYDQDGSVYMIDWYDQEQCHVSDPDVPDRGNGRIFKVSYGESRATRVDVQEASDDQLVDAQLALNDWHVRHSRRVLQERAAAGTLTPEAIQRLRALLGLEGSATSPTFDGRVRAVSAPEAQLRLLWALHVAGGLSEADALRLTGRHEEDLRAWAIQLASEDGRLSERALRVFGDLARKDPSPVVRLYLASAALRIAPERRWDLVRGLHSRAEDAADHNIPLMAWYALEPLVGLDVERGLALALDSKLPRSLEFAARRVASIGTPAALASLAALLEKVGEPRQLAVLHGMNAALGGQRSLPLPQGWSRVEAKLAASGDPRIRDEALSASLIFGSPKALATARRQLAHPASGLDRRKRTLAALLNVKDPGLPPTLAGLLRDADLRTAAIRGLAAYADAGTPGRLIALYPSLSEGDKREALLTLVSRPAFARPLLVAVGQDRIPVRDISAAIASQIRSLNQPDVTATLEKVWGVARETGAEKAAEIDRYEEMVDDWWSAEGPDLSLGRQLFERTCGACHKLFGEGGAIGPDITGSNRADLDYLLHNIINPNAEIPNAYRLATVQLKDGRVLAGFVNQQSAQVVTVKMLSETVAVPRADIASLTQSEVSMMPEGLLTPLSDDEVRALIAYLRNDEQVPLPRASVDVEAK